MGEENETPHCDAQRPALHGCHVDKGRKQGKFGGSHYCGEETTASKENDSQSQQKNLCHIMIFNLRVLSSTWDSHTQIFSEVTHVVFMLSSHKEYKVTTNKVSLHVIIFLSVVKRSAVIVFMNIRLRFPLQRSGIFIDIIHDFSPFRPREVPSILFPTYHLYLILSFHHTKRMQFT
jgi:hypothetical protein